MRAALTSMPLSPSPCPVPEFGGTITKSFSMLRPSDAAIYHSELDALAALSREIPGMDFFIGVKKAEEDFITREDQMAVARERIPAANIRFFESPVQDQHPWARDLGFWADQGNAFVVSGKTYTRDDTIVFSMMRPLIDQELASLREALEVRTLVPTDFAFEGGDILFGRNEVFVNQHIVNTDARLISARECFSDQVVLPLGTRPAISHLDLSVALVAEDTVLVNDPVGMYHILSSLSRDDLRSWQDRFRQRYLVREQAVGWSGSKPLTTISREVIRDVENINNRGKYGYDAAQRAMAYQPTAMDDVARQLEEAGKTVLRIPGMSFMGMPFSSINSLSDTFVEDGREKNRIFVPTFGLEAYDEAVLAALQGFGIFAKIIPIEVGWELALRGGGLRCVANVLRT